jgi:pyridoxine/pyridoxamine 5'-phosphate oxidase
VSEDRNRRIAAWRTEYGNRGLRREDLDTDPMDTFRTWFG